MAITKDKLLWSVKETCERLNLSRTTVLNLAYNGNLQSVKIGTRRMFFPDKVMNWAGITKETLPVVDVVDGMDLLEKRVSALERKIKNLAATSSSLTDELRPLVGLNHRQLGELEDTVKQLRANIARSLHTAQVEIYEQIALLTDVKLPVSHLFNLFL